MCGTKFGEEEVQIEEEEDQSTELCFSGACGIEGEENESSGQPFGEGRFVWIVEDKSFVKCDFCLSVWMLKYFRNAPIRPSCSPYLKSTRVLTFRVSTTYLISSSFNIRSTAEDRNKVNSLKRYLFPSITMGL